MSLWHSLCIYLPLIGELFKGKAHLIHSRLFPANQDALTHKDTGKLFGVNTCHAFDPLVSAGFPTFQCLALELRAPSTPLPTPQLDLFPSAVQQVFLCLAPAYRAPTAQLSLSL